MFTGLIVECGQVIDNQVMGDGRRLRIQAKFNDIREGESIAVQGVCLTVLTHVSDDLQFDVSPETLARSTLGYLQPGDRVHLERALQVGERMGGHYVSGHVDTRAYLASKRALGDYVEISIAGFSECDMLYLLPKGSIAVDGVSLTINAVEQGQVRLLLVPHTCTQTVLDHYVIGTEVNIEFDYLARLVAHQVKNRVLNADFVTG